MNSSVVIRYTRIECSTHHVPHLVIQLVAGSKTTAQPQFRHAHHKRP